MEVLLGPTFTIEVPPSTEPEIQKKSVGSGFGLLGSGSSLDEVSSGSSSSIGVPTDDSDDEAGEVESKLNEGGLCSLDSLEESLPIKRGLSNHFTGKSKSFANLSEVIQVEDLKKAENPFNKRRRILMASKWSRKSSFYNWPNPKSMPLLALNEDEQEEEEPMARDPLFSEDKEQESDEDDDDDENEMRRRAPKFYDRKLYSFKSRSCFDLQEYQK